MNESAKNILTQKTIFPSDIREYINWQLKILAKYVALEKHKLSRIHTTFATNFLICEEELNICKNTRS
jgi:hypothetical protein